MLHKELRQLRNTESKVVFLREEHINWLPNSPENTHVSGIMDGEHIIIRNMYIYINIHICKQ